MTVDDAGQYKSRMHFLDDYDVEHGVSSRAAVVHRALQQLDDAVRLHLIL